MRPRATAITFVLPKKSLRGGFVRLGVLVFFFLVFLLLGEIGIQNKRMGKGGGEMDYLLSDNCVRTSLR